MKKSELIAGFINAEKTGSKYIGVSIQTEGSSKPEIIINPKENFDEKMKYYTEAYDNDLILIAAKGKKDIRIMEIAMGASFEDIEVQLLLESRVTGWKQRISDVIDKVFWKMMEETKPEDEEERLTCELMCEGIKKEFISRDLTASEARFVMENIDEYEKMFEVSMNGNDLEFTRMLVELQKKQNQHMLKKEREKDE